MTIPVKMTVNGRVYERNVEPRLLLVHFLRETIGLTGTKVGCDTSQCGSCTVLDGRHRHQVVHAAGRAGRRLARSRPSRGSPPTASSHQVQESFWNKHGLQCGFCTPGMIMARVELLNKNPKPTPKQIRHGLEGNLCRCTGYQNIVRAVLRRGRDAREAAIMSAKRLRLGHPPPRRSAAHHRHRHLHRRHRAARTWRYAAILRSPHAHARITRDRHVARETGARRASPCSRPPTPRRR